MKIQERYLRTFSEFYKYDDAGNRIKKVVMKYTGESQDPTIEDSGDAPPYWNYELIQHYVRDFGGNELAIYNDTTVTFWNVYGIDNAGKINYSDNSWNYYLKDHLGSPRVVIDQNGDIISAEDLDMWGYKMADRSFQSDTTFYKYTGKERDVTTGYDYFGARYYDSRIGRWGQVEPLLEKYVNWSPYVYSLSNSVNHSDLDGRIVIFSQNTSKKIQFLNKVGQSLNKVESALVGVYNNLISESNLSGGIFDIRNVPQHDWIAVTGPMKFNYQGIEKVVIGIGLTDDFFTIENEIIAAILLDHELYHVSYYTQTEKLRTGSDLERWIFSNMDKYYNHELDAINRSMSQIETAYKNEQLSEKEYIRAKAQFIKNIEIVFNQNLTKFKNENEASSNINPLYFPLCYWL